MSGFLQDQIEKFKQMIEKEYAQGEISDNDDDSGMSTNLDKASITQTGISPNKIPQQASTIQQVPQAFKQKKMTEHDLKREERRKMREERKRQMERMEKEEVKYKVPDPQDVAAIEEALNSFGDFKLKMSPEYIVPEKE